MSEVHLTAAFRDGAEFLHLFPVEAEDSFRRIFAFVFGRDHVQVAARTGYSRFPVEEGGDLTGYLHLKDVLEFEEVHRTRPIARSWVRALVVVRSDSRLRAVLATMQRSGAHLARVEDEGGHLLGVVALEDVLEELVGEVRDEAAARARRTGA